MNSVINEEFKIAEQYKNKSNEKIREMEKVILREKLPALRAESSNYENKMTQDILKFENKTNADGMKL